jgi:hypothetical protein
MALNRYDAPTGAYSSRIPPGMAAFRKVVSEHFGYTRSEIVRDASRCRQTRSEHCECGACDFFTTDLLKGRLLFDWLGKHADALGVQSIIFNRRVRGFGNPAERHYTGPSPHTDHVHAGLNRWARQYLTETDIRALLPGQPPPQEDDLTPEQAQDLADVKKAVFTRREGVTYEHLNILENMLVEVGKRLSPPLEFNPDGTAKAGG